MPGKFDIPLLVASLIDEGNGVLASRFDGGDPNAYYADGRPIFVDLQRCERWRAKCKNLLRILGDSASHFAPVFHIEGNRETVATKMLATLEALHETIQHGLLIRSRDLVFAEAFDNLLEQADHLFSQGYHLAAGVLGRAVLEEHLRNWCGTAGCTPTKAKPTLNDFKLELQKASHLTVTQVKHVDYMGGIGNDAAHNKQELKQDDVERLLRDVREFIGKYP